MGTPGSASGLEKRIGGNTGTALQADSSVPTLQKKAGMGVRDDNDQTWPDPVARAGHRIWPPWPRRGGNGDPAGQRQARHGRSPHRELGL